jgi:hypothetical protein
MENSPFYIFHFSFVRGEGLSAHGTLRRKRAALFTAAPGLTGLTSNGMLKVVIN